MIVLYCIPFSSLLQGVSLFIFVKYHADKAIRPDTLLYIDNWFWTADSGGRVLWCLSGICSCCIDDNFVLLFCWANNWHLFYYLNRYFESLFTVWHYIHLSFSTGIFKQNVIYKQGLRNRLLCELLSLFDIHIHF